MPPEGPDVGLRSMGVARRFVWLAGVLAAILGGCAPSTTPQSKPLPVVSDEPQVTETRDVVGKPDNPVTTAREPEPPDELIPADPFPKKLPVPAAALEGGVEWLNTAEPITLAALRGKVVVLDFWTYCCINCMHVLPHLKKLEEKYANELVVIGVHSAKFETERESQNIREAILRYEINHPVVNDANMIIWRHFDVSAWPTLMVIDPEGNLVGYIPGEQHVYELLDQAIGVLVKYHRKKGTLNEDPMHFDLEHRRAEETALRFPGKVLADAASDRLFISDSNHNRIVITTLAGKLIDMVGTGEVGKADGEFDRATFFRPQGLALDGDTLYLADTENHSIRCVNLKARVVTTVIGTGQQGSSRSHQPMPVRVDPKELGKTTNVHTEQEGGAAIRVPKDAELNSPWDLCWHEGKLYIAMAGPHQIWVWNPQTDEVNAYAGSGREDIEDGDLMSSAFAQPSGLASDGEWLYVADSEGSSIRAVPLIPEKDVWTVVGTADLDAGRLFEFGDVDGENGKARLQHPLGVAWHKGAIYVADTYNNKIKAIDPEKRFAITFLGTGEPGKTDDPALFDEPGGLSVAGDKLYVADTNNHSIRVVDLKTNEVSTLTIDGLTPPKTREAD